MEIPGIVLRPTHKNPLKRYLIDKIYLASQGMSLADIERIYRAMFVYSVGFYEMISKCVQHAKNKYCILSSFWKVFQILLEYCCQSQYKMMIAEITEEHKNQMDAQEDKFEQEIDRREQNERKLRDSVQVLSSENAE